MNARNVSVVKKSIVLDCPFDLGWDKSGNLIGIEESRDPDLLSAFQPYLNPSDQLVIIDVKVYWAEGCPGIEDRREAKRIYVERSGKEVDLPMRDIKRRASRALQSLIEGWELDEDRLDLPDEGS